MCSLALCSLAQPAKPSSDFMRFPVNASQILWQYLIVNPKTLYAHYYTVYVHDLNRRIHVLLYHLILHKFIENTDGLEL